MSKTIKNYGNTVVATNVETIVPSQWRSLGTVPVNNGYETNYQLMAADPDYPASLRIGIYYNAKLDRTDVSVRLTTVAVDGSAAPEIVREAAVTLAFNTPGKYGLHNVADIQTLVMNVFGITFQTVTNGTPDSDVFMRWANGIPTL